MSLIVEQWPIERCVMYARNPRKNDSQVDRMASAIKEFGFRTGDLSIYYSIRSLVRAIALGAVSGLFFKKNSKAVLIGFTFITCLAYVSVKIPARSNNVFFRTNHKLHIDFPAVLIF